MTPLQYRTHKNRALAAAFLSGELVGLSGSRADNPYRARSSSRRPTRGSWSESYARAWAMGKQTGERHRALLDDADRARARGLADAGAE